MEGGGGEEEGADGVLGGAAGAAAARAAALGAMSVLLPPLDVARHGLEDVHFAVKGLLNAKTGGWVGGWVCSTPRRMGGSVGGWVAPYCVLLCVVPAQRQDGWVGWSPLTVCGWVCRQSCLTLPLVAPVL